MIGKLSKHTRTALLDSFRHPAHSWPGWFIVWDERANNELAQTFGLCTDEVQPVYNLNDAYKIRFNWHLQAWMVQA